MRADAKTTSRIRGTSPELQAVARTMRENMTPAEYRLWEAISRKQLCGLRFRAQHPVGQFIADFYCSRYKLVVEVDGPIHGASSEQDEARTQHFEAFGYRVIRFTNEQVMNDLEAVLSQILKAASSLESSDSPIIGGWGA